MVWHFLKWHTNTLRPSLMMYCIEVVRDFPTWNSTSNKLMLSLVSSNSMMIGMRLVRSWARMFLFYMIFWLRCEMSVTVDKVAQTPLQLPSISSILLTSTANDPCESSNVKWTPLSTLARISNLTTLRWFLIPTPAMFTCMVTWSLVWVRPGWRSLMVGISLPPPNRVWMLFCVSMVALVIVFIRRTTSGSLPSLIAKIRKLLFLSFLVCDWISKISKY